MRKIFFVNNATFLRFTIHEKFYLVGGYQFRGSRYIDIQIFHNKHEKELMPIPHLQDREIFQISGSNEKFGVLCSKNRRSETFKNNIKQDFEHLLNDTEYSDITFEVNGGTLHAHKFILVSRCMYFKALFENSFEETNQNILKLTHDYDIFKGLIEFIYIGRVKFETFTSTVLLWIQLYILADIFLMENLKKYSKDQFKFYITTKNAAKLLCLSFYSYSKEFSEFLISFIRRNFLRVKKTEDYKKLDKNMLFAILEDCDLC